MPAACSVRRSGSPPSTPLRARSLVSVPRTTGERLTDRQLAARERIVRAMDALGGADSPAGSAVWNVVGCERSIREWAALRGMHHVAAGGVLVSALGVLAPALWPGTAQPGGRDVTDCAGLSRWTTSARRRVGRPRSPPRRHGTPSHDIPRNRVLAARQGPLALVRLGSCSGDPAGTHPQAARASLRAGVGRGIARPRLPLPSGTQWSRRVWWCRSGVGRGG